MRPVRGAGKCRGSPPASKPPFSFSEEKENAPFDGVREKGSGGGIPDFVRNARSAYYGGLAWRKPAGFAHSTKYGSYKSWGPARMHRPPLFTAAPWQFERARRRSFDTHRIASAKKKQGLSGSTPSTKLRQLPGCGSKTGAGGIRERPQLTKLPYAVEWSKALESAPQ